MSLAIFDLDGTLVDQADAARRWASEFGDAERLSPAQIVELAASLVERRSKGEIFREFIRAHSLSLDADALWREYRLRMPQLVQCAEADLDALRNLRSSGWAIGIVTNGEVDNQESKIRKTGLVDVVDGWVISTEVGARKPDSKIFTALAHRIGVPLAGWMIGDGLDADIVGGAAVGLETAWISNGLSLRPNDPVPTIVAASAHEAIAEIIARDESGLSG